MIRKFYFCIVFLACLASVLMSTREANLTKNYIALFKTENYQALYNFADGMAETKFGKVCLVSLESNYVLVIYELQNNSNSVINLLPVSTELYSETTNDLTSKIEFKMFGISPILIPDDFFPNKFHSTVDPIIGPATFMIKEVRPNSNYSFCFITTLDCESIIFLKLMILNGIHRKDVMGPNHNENTIQVDLQEGDSVEIQNYCAINYGKW